MVYSMIIGMFSETACGQKEHADFFDTADDKWCHAAHSVYSSLRHSVMISGMATGFVLYAVKR
jgi:hypothetical protein